MAQVISAVFLQHLADLPAYIHEDCCIALVLKDQLNQIPRLLHDNKAAVIRPVCLACC